MMSETCMGDLLGMLHAKYIQRGRARDWTRAVAQLYTVGLASLQDDIAREAIRRLLLDGPSDETDRPRGWIPDVSEIRHEAVIVASPYPTEFAAWRWVESNMGRLRPATADLHPIEREALADLGGLDMLWHQTRYSEPATPISVIRAQYRDAYRLRVREHHARTLEIISTLQTWDGKPLLAAAGSPPRAIAADTRIALDMPSQTVEERIWWPSPHAGNDAEDAHGE